MLDARGALWLTLCPFLHFRLPILHLSLFDQLPQRRNTEGSSPVCSQNRGLGVDLETYTQYGNAKWDHKSTTLSLAQVDSSRLKSKRSLRSSRGRLRIVSQYQSRLCLRTGRFTRSIYATCAILSSLTAPKIQASTTRRDDRLEAGRSAVADKHGEHLQVRFTNGTPRVLQGTWIYYQCGYVWLDWALVLQGVLVDLYRLHRELWGSRVVE